MLIQMMKAPSQGFTAADAYATLEARYQRERADWQAACARIVLYSRQIQIALYFALIGLCISTLGMVLDAGQLSVVGGVLSLAAVGICAQGRYLQVRAIKRANAICEQLTATFNALAFLRPQA